MQTILILAANPKDTPRVRLDEEVREIDAGLQRAKHRNQFVLEQKWAVRPRDIQRAMLDLNPQIVHFSGHGTGDEGLAFEDETGSAKLVDSEALAGLFDLFADQLECIILNGCYSEVQAEAISQHIKYVIGMSKAIGDRAAIEFAVGFYDALGSGRSVEFAYKLGCAAIRFVGDPEQLTPILKKKPIIANYTPYREDTKLVPVGSTDTTVDEKLPCPYRGLYHFRHDDAEFFFGREVFVEELFEATKNRNFIPVLGASGSGKSSVVFAGLVPKLLQAGHWKFTYFRPGSDPFQALAMALIPFYTPNLNKTEQMVQARQLAGYFRDNTLPLDDIFTQIEQNHLNYRILLIADQFEELYTLCPEQKIRHSFLDTLLASFQSDSGNTNVLVATIRADFLGNALSYPKFGDVLRNADVKIRSMNREELSQVIVKPPEKLGVTFQDGLVKRILNDIEDEPGNLPLLEFALTEVWKRRTGKQLTHAAYEEIGEVKGALARHADLNYRKLSATEQEQMRRIFIQLVRPGEGCEDTRRLATKAELGEDKWSLVQKLAAHDARLVVTSQNAANLETVEIVHEALIRNWGELRQWMDADRSFRAWQERLRVVIYQWQQTQQDEGALLRGAALEDAEEKLKKCREDLSVGEQEFIQASVAMRDREKKQEQINEINALSQSSDALFNSDPPKALISSIKAAVKMQGQPWVDVNTQTQVKLVLLNTVHNVAAPNTLGGHAKTIWNVSFSPDGLILASASVDKTVKLWDTSTGKQIKTLSGHTDSVQGVSFSPDGLMLASASDDNTVKLWDTSTGKQIKTLSGHVNWVDRVRFSPGGLMLASASGDKTVKLWDTSTGKQIKSLSGHTNYIQDISFSPNGKMLASASADYTVKLWDTSTGKEIKTLSGHTNLVWGVSFSPDGLMLASASGDKTVKLWDTDTGQQIKTLSEHTNDVQGISFSPDGLMLASGGHDKTVKLWDTNTGKELKTLTGHKNAVQGVNFSPDGLMLASANGDKTVKLWDTSTGKELKTLTGHTNDVRGVSFSPDGLMLASASADYTVKLWRLDFNYLLNQGCNFLREYFKTNPPDNESDKHLCDGVISSSDK